MRTHMVISVFSKDRPGIIADISNVIFELNGDLADMSQSVLSGFFSMIVIAEFENAVTEDIISEKIKTIPSKTELNCIVKATDKLPLQTEIKPSGDIYVVTGQGKNRTGLVASMGAFCNERNINIIGYNTLLSGETYSMMLDIDIPPTLSVDSIHKELDFMAENLGLKIVMQHKDLFKSVNEITL